MPASIPALGAVPQAIAAVGSVGPKEVESSAIAASGGGPTALSGVVALAADGTTDRCRFSGHAAVSGAA